MRSSLIFLNGTASPQDREHGVLSRFFIGTNTWGSSKGIYACSFDRARGQIGQPELVAETPGPANLLLHPSRKFLYAGAGRGVDKKHIVFEGSSPLTAFAIEPDGYLRSMNSIPSGGRTPTHGVVSKNGRFLLTCCFGSGLTIVVRLADDGSLQERVSVIEKPHSPMSHGQGGGPHIVVLSPSERFAVVAEMGADNCAVYRFDSDAGALAAHSEAATPKGEGPRHVTFHPGGKFAYSANEHGSSVTTFAWDEVNGRLMAEQTISALPSGFAGRNRASDIHVHPNGKFVYLGNRGHDSIAIFTVDPASGHLALRGHVSSGGRTPWAFHIVNSGDWMIVPNMGSDNVVVFRIDPATGDLIPNGCQVQLSAPTCLAEVDPDAAVVFPDTLELLL